MTDYTAMVMAPEIQRILVKHIQLVPVTEGRALAVIVTDAGLVRDAFINVPRNCCSSDLERYSALLTDRVRNQDALRGGQDPGGGIEWAAL